MHAFILIVLRARKTQIEGVKGHLLTTKYILLCHLIMRAGNIKPHTSNNIKPCVTLIQSDIP